MCLEITNIALIEVVTVCMELRIRSDVHYWVMVLLVHLNDLEHG